MTTNVANTSAATGALAALGNLKQGLQNVQSGIRVAGGEPILRMGKDGIWIYGADNVEVEPGSTWAVNPMSLTHGYICWKEIPQGSKEKAELLGEEVRSMFQPLPNKDALPDYGHPWDEVLSVQLKCVSGEDAGEQTLYKTSSTGGLRAMKELIGAIMKAIDEHPETPVPVVELDTDTYQHKTWGKTYFPVIHIRNWMSMEGVEAEAPAAEPEKKPAEAPASQTRRGRAAPVNNVQAVQQASEQDDEDEQEDLTVVQPQVQQTAAGGEGVRRRRRAA